MASGQAGGKIEAIRRLERREKLETFGLAGTLVVTTIASGAWIHARYGSLTSSALGGAFIALGIHFGLGALYRRFASKAWGAPFAIGERVRVVSGAFSGLRGRVIGLDQAERPEVELHAEGETLRVQLPWRYLRRDP